MDQSGGRARLVLVVRIDAAGLPSVALAALPAAVSALLGPVPVTLALLLLPVAVAAFFRDPDRESPLEPNLVLAPADGKVMYAGPAHPDEAPPGAWLQCTVFLSPFDVHINRTPVSGRVTQVTYQPGTCLPAYRRESFQNERTEIWVEHHGALVVFRQVVGVLARRVVCRVKAGDELAPGERIGLMKFGSRMDVFVPDTASLRATTGDQVRAGVTVIAVLVREP